MTNEKWFLSDRGFYENGYVVELQGVPGLSGAPVMTYGQEIQFNPLRFRSLPPMLVGVVKDVLVFQDPGKKQFYSQGLTVIEPGYKLRALLAEIASIIKKQGGSPNLEFGALPAPQ